jgi:hypothetical protein
MKYFSFIGNCHNLTEILLKVALSTMTNLALTSVMAAGMTSLSWHQVDFQMPVGETVERLRHLLPQLAGPVVNRPATSTVHSSCCCYSCAAKSTWCQLKLVIPAAITDVNATRPEFLV